MRSVGGPRCWRLARCATSTFQSTAVSCRSRARPSWSAAAVRSFAGSPERVDVRAASTQHAHAGGAVASHSGGAARPASARHAAAACCACWAASRPRQRAGPSSRALPSMSQVLQLWEPKQRPALRLTARAAAAERVHARASAREGGARHAAVVRRGKTPAPAFFTPSPRSVLRFFTMGRVKTKTIKKARRGSTSAAVFRRNPGAGSAAHGLAWACKLPEQPQRRFCASLGLRRFVRLARWARAAQRRRRAPLHPLPVHLRSFRFRGLAV